MAHTGQKVAGETPAGPRRGARQQNPCQNEKTETKTFKHANIVTTLRLSKPYDTNEEYIDMIDTLDNWYRKETTDGEHLVIIDGDGGLARFIWVRGKGIVLNQAIVLCKNKWLECNCTSDETDDECMQCLDKLTSMDCDFIRYIIRMWVSGMPEDKHRKAKEKLGIE